MRLYQFLCVFAFLIAAQAAEESATVAEGKINVRGKPSLIGEVITQLEQGEKVTVLERVTNSTAKTGEPTNWGKIKLPPNTPVWVFAPFVKDGVVSVSRLNVRAGRGENYSVIGRINRGEEIKPIRTMEEWMEIEPPTNAYAFVDLNLLQFEGQPARVPQPASAPPLEVAQPSTPPTTAPPTTSAGAKPESITAAAPALVATPEPASNLPTEKEIVVATVPSPTTEQAAPPAEPDSPQTPQAVARAPESTSTQQPSTATPPISVASEPTPATTEAPATNSLAATPTNQSPSPRSEPLPQLAPPIENRGTPRAKRIVRREGIVRATTSIQAPTWYELVHADTKKRINYLFEENLGLDLKDYRGQRVVVSGEEGIDPRWPNTPILDMQTLDVLPDATR